MCCHHGHIFISSISVFVLLSYATKAQSAMFFGYFGAWVLRGEKNCPTSLRALCSGKSVRDHVVGWPWQLHGHCFDLGRKQRSVKLFVWITKPLGGELVEVTRTVVSTGRKRG